MSELRSQFACDGYVVVPDLVTTGQSDALVGEWSEILDRLARSLHAEHAIASPHDGLSFQERLIAVCAESRRNFPEHFDANLPQDAFPPDAPIYLGDAFFSLLVTPAILDIVEALIGPEIAVSPVHHVRMKLPERAVAADVNASSLVVATDWHQDNGVLTEAADDSTIISVWVAITDATEENGCLKVVPGTHRGGLLAHCPTDASLPIPDRLLPLEQAIPLPMAAGSAVFFDQRLVHGSLPNRRPDEVRISADLRYQPVGQATGRDFLPVFVGRSAADPDSVLRDPDAWRELWLQARAELADRSLPPLNRWDPTAPVCA